MLDYTLFISSLSFICDVAMTFFCYFNRVGSNFMCLSFLFMISLEMWGDSWRMCAERKASSSVLSQVLHRGSLVFPRRVSWPSGKISRSWQSNTKKMSFPSHHGDFSFPVLQSSRLKQHSWKNYINKIVSYFTFPKSFLHIHTPNFTF